LKEITELHLAVDGIDAKIKNIGIDCRHTTRLAELSSVKR